MSTFASAIPAHHDQRAAAHHRAGGSTVRWLRDHWWGFCDQLLISGTNFGTMVLTARALRPDSIAFGEFSLVYSAMLFTNIVQSTLVTQPHNVLGSTRAGPGYARYTTATGFSQLLIVLLQAGLALLIAATAFARGWHVAPLLLALAPSIVAWQLQEFIRRVLYTEDRLNAAFCNDLISYGGQLIAIFVLFRMQRLTGPLALYVLAATSFLAVLVGLFQIRRSLTWHIDRASLRENWNFGKWLLGAELVGWCSSLHMYLFIAAIILGPQASGELKGAQILFGPTRVFAFFLQSVLPIRFARAFAAGGKDALHGQFKSALTLIVPLLGSYCLFVAIFAQPLLRFLYGSAFAGSALVLALYSVSAFLNYTELFFSAALTATRQTRYIFIGYVCGGVIAFSLSWFIIRSMGVEGAINCMILTAVIVTAMFIWVYRKTIASQIAADRGLEVILAEQAKAAEGGQPA